MGCVASRKIDNEERVQRCRERKRLMKQLVVLRAEFACAQMTYLHSLKNTGITLRQFAEAESLELDISPFDITLPPPPSSLLPPPPPPLPILPPPPPPPFSPERTEGSDEEESNSKSFIGRLVQVPHRRGDMREECSGMRDEEEISGKGKLVQVENGHLPPPPPPPPPPGFSSSSWDFLDPFAPLYTSASPDRKKSGSVGQKVEEEDWEEAKTEFEDEEEDDEEEEEEEEEEEVEEEEDEQEDEVVNELVVLNSLREKASIVDLTDDNSSVASWNTKDTADVGMVPQRRNNSLLGIVKEIDDYFLKAYDSGRDVAVLLEMNRGDSLHQDFEDSQRKSFKSAKVFSALSWSWSSKSLQSSKDAIESHDSNEPCKPGAHCITLEKLNVEEERLYKEIKEEEITKLEYERKTLLLQKQETGNQDALRTEEVRANIESLESNLSYLQHSISKTCLSILKLRDEELHPQLLELSSRLMRMWRTMYECHQVQNNIAQQVNHLTDISTEPTTDHHRQATAQLETEVSAWYNSFCNLLKSQREYVKVLNRWVQLANCLVEDLPPIDCTTNIHILCEEWQLSLERLPEQVAAESIKSFVLVIHSIVLQQTQEGTLQKKSERLEKRLEKELNTLNEMEKKFEGNLTAEAGSSLSPNHPLIIKRARIEAFKKKVEDEKAKYLHSVQVSRAMTLNNLQTSLPNVFQALTGFSSVCVQTFEAFHGLTQSSVVPHDVNVAA